MKFRNLSLLAVFAILSVVACKRQTTVEIPVATPIPEPVAKTKTLETARLGRAVDEYERNPTSENRAEVNKATADLDGEIAELEVLVAKRNGDSRAEAETKWTNLRSYRAGEIARFTAAQAKSPVTAPARADGRSGVDKAEASAEHFGKSIEKNAQKAGDAIKDVVR